MATAHKNEFHQDNKQDNKNKRPEDINSKSGQAATEVNKTREMHSEQGRSAGIKTVKNEEENLDREKVDAEDDEIAGERESQEEGRVKNFRESGSDAHR